jgi:hypothetical protein
MTTRWLLTACALALGLSFTVSAAEAKTCKDVVTARARSAAQVSDAARLDRARNNAIANWKKRARSSYGYLYSFWNKSDEQKVECGGGASAKHCTVSAKPCRVY